MINNCLQGLIPHAQGSERTRSLAAALAIGIASAFAIAPAQAQLLGEFPRSVEATAIQTLLSPQNQASTALHRLPANSSALTFQGEYATIELPVYLTDQQALQIRGLQLDLVTAVSVLPAASRIEVYANDQRIGDTTLVAASEARRTVVPLEPGNLVGGFNSLKFVVWQRHRVDCTLNATYELWTVINPETSGFTMAATVAPQRLEVVDDLRDLATAPRNSDGQTIFEIVVGRDVRRSNLDQALRVAQSVAIAGRYATPDVKIVAAASAKSGIQILVGTKADLQGQNPAISRALTGNRDITLVRDTQTGVLTLVITARSRPALDVIIDKFQADLADLTFSGSPSGLRAAAHVNGYPIEQGDTIKLADLGVSAEPFSGRLMRNEFSLSLPDDFFAANYNSASLAIRIDAFDEMDDSNRLEIEVNGAIVASTRYQQRAGSRMHHIEIPLGGFSAGKNDILIALSSTTEADADCDVVAPRLDPRVQIDAEASSIRFNSLATLNVVPNLSATQLLPQFQVVNGQAVTVQLPARDLELAEAAASMIVALAAETQSITPVRLAFGAASQSDPAGLTIAPRALLGGSASRTLGEIQSAETANAGSPFAPIEAATRHNTLIGPWVGTSVETVSKALRGMGFRIGNSTGLARAQDSTAEDLLIYQYASDLTSSERTAAFMGFPVRQRVNTVITGADEAQISSALQSLIRERKLNWVAGDLTSYARDEDRFYSARVFEATYKAQAIDPRNASNTRLVVAGMISDYTLHFATVVAILGLLFGFLAFAVIRMSGKRS